MRRYIVFFVVVICAGFVPIASACWQGFARDDRPAKGVNNIWYEYNESDTVFVFVHGVLSDSRGAWYYEGDQDKPPQYWPAIIRNCAEFNKPSVFLGGFYTGLDSGPYGMRDAANELKRGLTLSKQPAPVAVLDKKNIVFVTHSTGGIVVRHMLVRNPDLFQDKTVGLMLIASPSLGSQDADRLNLFMAMFKHKMGRELQWDNAFLEELDNDFKDLVDDGVISGLVGAEALENHFVVPGLIWGTRQEVVTKDSGARYFGAPTRLGGTDHFSTVKPHSENHPAHSCLREFYEQKFLPKTKEVSQATAPYGEYRFLTKHEVLAQRGQVEVIKDTTKVAVAPFDHPKSIAYGVYTASAVIDSKETLKKIFHIDTTQEAQVHFDHDFQITGLVTDGEGKRLGNIVVSVTGKEFVTKDDGTFFLGDLPMSRYYAISAHERGNTVLMANPWQGTVYNRNWGTDIVYNIVLTK